VQAALGCLYRKTGLKHEAAQAYRACLEQQPLALEAVVALAELGKEKKWCCGWTP
jgi:hypothetical protein